MAIKIIQMNLTMYQSIIEFYIGVAFIHLLDPIIKRGVSWGLVDWVGVSGALSSLVGCEFWKEASLGEVSSQLICDTAKTESHLEQKRLQQRKYKTDLGMKFLG